MTASFISLVEEDALCRIFSALLQSQFEMWVIAFIASSCSFIPSFLAISFNIKETCSSFNGLNLKIAHLDCIGSMILLEKLQLKINLQVFVKFSMVLLNACCASFVRASDSSR